jgi:hypothetical protein
LATLVPHDFAVRLIRRPSAPPKRPPHPAPNVRDDRETPLFEGRGTGELVKVICPTWKAGNFSRREWTGQIRLMRLRKLDFWRNAKSGKIEAAQEMMRKATSLQADVRPAAEEAIATLQRFKPPK